MLFFFVFFLLIFVLLSLLTNKVEYIAWCLLTCCFYVLQLNTAEHVHVSKKYDHFVYCILSSEGANNKAKLLGLRGGGEGRRVVKTSAKLTEFRRRRVGMLYKLWKLHFDNHRGTPGPAAPSPHRAILRQIAATCRYSVYSSLLAI